MNAKKHQGLGVDITTNLSGQEVKKKLEEFLTKEFPNEIIYVNSDYEIEFTESEMTDMAHQ